MNTTIRNSSLITLALMVNLSYATENDSLLKAKLNQAKTFNQTELNEAIKYQLYIKNQKGQILHQENMVDETFLTTGFDFKYLADGTYSAELVDGFRTQILPLKVNNNRMEAMYEDLSVIYEPTIYKRGKKIFLNMYASEKSKLEVKIIDHKNQVVCQKSIYGKGNLGEIFDFSKVGLGRYKLSIQIQGRDYVKTIVM